MRMFRWMSVIRMVRWMSDDGQVDRVDECGEVGQVDRVDHCVCVSASRSNDQRFEPCQEHKKNL